MPARLIAAILLASCVEAHASTSLAERAVLHLLRAAPGHPMRRNDDMRHELSTALDEAGADALLDPVLLAVMAFRESSYRATAVGKRGEVGILQVFGTGARDCDGMDTVRGQALCGARWLRACTDRCGSIEAGLTAYASGSCTPRTETTRRVVAARIRLWMETRAAVVEAGGSS